MGRSIFCGYALAIILGAGSGLAGAQEARRRTPQADAVTDVQTPRAVPATRPEQRLSAHDRGSGFSSGSAQPSSSAFHNQPDGGRAPGFDFARDALGAKKPMQTFEDTLKADKADRLMHDGRCLTLEDTVEFFNLVLGLKLDAAEKADLVAFMRQL